jgi:predicted  nucleic acid-binding Zn-ribbon protein
MGGQPFFRPQHWVFLMNEANPAGPSLAKAQEEVRLARRELERWQAAYDRYQGDDSRRFHSEIRAAEQRLHAARARLRELRRS